MGVRQRAFLHRLLRSSLAARGSRSERRQSARCVETFLFEAVSNLLCDFVALALIHQRDDGATKAAAGHTCAVRAVDTSHIHGNIQLGHSHFIIRCERIMRSVEQSSGFVDLAVGEGTYEGVDARNLSDHMTHALLHRVVFQLVERFLERLERIVGLGDAVGNHTQVGHAEDFGGLLAGGAALGILAVVELVRSLSVEHHQLQTVLVEIELLLGDILQRAQLRAAVQAQRMAERAAHGGVLVEAAGGGAGHVVLGLDGGVDQRHTAGVGSAVAQAVHVIQRQGGGAGHGCGGAQTGSERHAGGECRIEALHRIEAGFDAVQGFDAAFSSCVPLGSGLSSSAAMTCSTALALDDVYGLGYGASDAGRVTLINAAIKSENDMAGASTGGLDQNASMRCTFGHALRLDCRPELSPLENVSQQEFDLDKYGLELMVLDTQAPHQLNDGQYAQRRATCEKAAEILGVANLRVVADSIAKSDDPFQALKETLDKLEDDTMKKRVRHVITEIARVNSFVRAFANGKIDEAGRLFNASHDSLAADYEVTVPELDIAVDVARVNGAYGARMTGGGFGGSIIALVDKGQGHEIAQKIADRFEKEGFNAPRALPAFAAASASREA